MFNDEPDSSNELEVEVYALCGCKSREESIKEPKASSHNSTHCTMAKKEKIIGWRNFRKKERKKTIRKLKCCRAIK